MTNDAAGTPSVTLYAAGSLRRAFAELLPLFEQAQAISVDALFGPAGLLRQRIEAGDGAEIFASANMDHPRRLFETGLFDEPVRFVRNEICAVVRRDLGIDTDGLLDAMLDPAIVLATSTPIADPSGDYAQAVFERADRIRPGIGRALAAKAHPLLGGGFGSDVPAGVAPGAWLIEAGRADIVLGYSSGTLGIGSSDPCSVVNLPDAIAVTAEYGLAVARGSGPAAKALAAFLAGRDGEGVLLRHGFLPRKGRDDA